MKRKNLLGFFILFVQTFYSQNVLMTINNDNIFVDDFINSQEKSLKLIGVKNTIDNFIDFDLLRQYAIKKEAFKNESFQKNMANRVLLLRDSMFYSPQKVEPVIKNYYQHLVNERKVQVLAFDPNKFYSQKNPKAEVNKLLSELKQGKTNFSALIKKESIEKKYSNPVYIKPFELNYDLENAIYNAKINEYTFVEIEGKPYILYVSNERKNLGYINLFCLTIKDTSEQGKQKAEKIFNELKNKDNFLDFKKKYDEDKTNCNSVDNDTLYNFISSANKNDVFPPIKTEKGYQIFKLILREPIGSFQNEKLTLLKTFQTKDVRIPFDNEIIQELRNSEIYKTFDNNVNSFLNSLPDTYEQFSSYPPATEKINLIGIDNEYFLTNLDVIEALKTQISEEQKLENIKQLAISYMTFWSNNELYAYYNANFENTPRIQKLFKQTEDEELIKFAISYISYQAQNDVEGQKKYLQEQKNNLVWKDRVEATLFYCADKNETEKLKNELKKNTKTDQIQRLYNNKTNEKGELLVVINSGKFTQDFLKLQNEKIKQGQIFDKVLNGKNVVIKIDKILKPESMSLEELQSKYLSEYIDYALSKNQQQLKKEAKIDFNETEINQLKLKYKP